MNQNFKNMKNLIILFFLATIFMAIFTSNCQNVTQTCYPTTITKVEHEGAGNRITWTQPTGKLFGGRCFAFIERDLYHRN